MRTRLAVVGVGCAVIAVAAIPLAASSAHAARVTVTPGASLKVRVAPALPGNGSYTIRLEKKVAKKGKVTWKKVGTYKTAGKDESKMLNVGGSNYRITVLKGSTVVGTRALPALSRGAAPLPAASKPTGTYSQDAWWVYYFPHGYSATNGNRYPAIVTFSPVPATGAPGPYDTQLKSIADTYGFVVMSSKYYGNQGWNAPYADPVSLPDQYQYAMNWSPGWDSCNGNYWVSANYANARNAMLNSFAQYSIDTSRVVLMGLSGGASYSHALNIRYPDLARAVVINTGMIWGVELPVLNGVETTNGPRFGQWMDSCRTASDYSGAREAFFLESSGSLGGPVDFRYEEMLVDAQRYRNVGWNVHEYDFAGGHTMAPQSMYNQVFSQLVNSPAWR